LPATYINKTASVLLFILHQFLKEQKERLGWNDSGRGPTAFRKNKTGNTGSRGAVCAAHPVAIMRGILPAGINSMFLQNAKWSPLRAIKKGYWP